MPTDRELERTAARIARLIEQIRMTQAMTNAQATIPRRRPQPAKAIWTGPDRRRVKRWR